MNAHNSYERVCVPCYVVVSLMIIAPRSNDERLEDVKVIFDNTPSFTPKEVRDNKVGFIYMLHYYNYKNARIYGKEFDIILGKVL